MSTRKTIRPEGIPSFRGIVFLVAMAALPPALVAALLALAISMFSSLSVDVSLPFVLIAGLVQGSIVGLVRRGASMPLVVTLAVGAVTTVVWLLAGGLTPFVAETFTLGGFLATVATFVLGAILTRRGLKEIDLWRPPERVMETLIVRLLHGFGYVFFVFIVIFPFYFMVASSVKSRAEYLEDPGNLSINVSRSPGDLFVGYVKVLTEYRFARYILNSTMVALASVVLSITPAILGAYAVTRLRFPGRNFISRAILLIYMFPAIVLVIPLYSVFTRLGLRDTLAGLLIVYAAMTIPVALYMLRSYFQTLPKDIEESGLIDGCGRGEVILRITLPLSGPALATVALYIFMIAWNEFLFAFMFLDSPEIFTLSRGMVALNTQEVPRQYLMSGAVIITVPIMVIFFWFEKYLVSGLTAGGVKG
jgi:multiple sugar transport system permease protein